MERPEQIEPEFRISAKWVLCVVALGATLIACTTVLTGGDSAARSPHEWDPKNGHVVPHDTFPTNCSLCHVADNMPALVEGFTFDHEAQTGVRLEGAHTKASCLRCHNNRGSVERFAARGCAGCHVNPHQTAFGSLCSDCHDKSSWVIKNPKELHRHTRFPLTGAHVAVSCFRCHEGAQVGNFKGEVASCESCHQEALAAAPSFHIPAGLTRDCQRCHVPMTWHRRR